MLWLIRLAEPQSRGREEEKGRERESDGWRRWGGREDGDRWRDERQTVEISISRLLDGENEPVSFGNGLFDSVE